MVKKLLPKDPFPPIIITIIVIILLPSPSSQSLPSWSPSSYHHHRHHSHLPSDADWGAEAGAAAHNPKHSLPPCIPQLRPLAGGRERGALKGRLFLQPAPGVAWRHGTGRRRLEGLILGQRAHGGRGGGAPAAVGGRGWRGRAGGTWGTDRHSYQRCQSRHHMFLDRCTQVGWWFGPHYVDNFSLMSSLHEPSLVGSEARQDHSPQSIFLLQLCPLFREAQMQQWPHAEMLREELWGNTVDLLTATTFIYTIGLTIWPRTMPECRRQSYSHWCLKCTCS